MERCIAAFSARSERIGETYSFDDVYERLSENGVPKLVIFSSDFDNFSLYSGLFREKFPESHVIGMSSDCIFSSEGCSDTGLSALAIYSGIECACGVLHEAGRCPIKYIKNALEAIDELGITARDSDRVCCLEFTACAEYNEELVLDTFREARGSSRQSTNSINRKFLVRRFMEPTPPFQSWTVTANSPGNGCCYIHFIGNSLRCQPFSCNRWQKTAPAQAQA